MKYNIRVTARFQKDLKRMHRRGYDISLLTEIIRKLSEGKTLPETREKFARQKGYVCVDRRGKEN